jgi:hypothetical protein
LVPSALTIMGRPPAAANSAPTVNVRRDRFIVSLPRAFLSFSLQFS